LIYILRLPATIPVCCRSRYDHGCYCYRLRYVTVVTDLIYVDLICCWFALIYVCGWIATIPTHFTHTFGDSHLRYGLDLICCCCYGVAVYDFPFPPRSRSGPFPRSGLLRLRSTPDLPLRCWTRTFDSRFVAVVAIPVPFVDTFDFLRWKRTRSLIDWLRCYGCLRSLHGYVVYDLRSFYGYVCVTTLLRSTFVTLRWFSYGLLRLGFRLHYICDLVTRSTAATLRFTPYCGWFTGYTTTTPADSRCVRTTVPVFYSSTVPTFLPTHGLLPLTFRSRLHSSRSPLDYRFCTFWLVVPGLPFTGWFTHTTRTVTLDATLLRYTTTPLRLLPRSHGFTPTVVTHTAHHVYTAPFTGYICLPRLRFYIPHHHYTTTLDVTATPCAVTVTPTFTDLLPDYHYVYVRYVCSRLIWLRLRFTWFTVTLLIPLVTFDSVGRLIRLDTTFPFRLPLRAPHDSLLRLFTFVDSGYVYGSTLLVITTLIYHVYGFTTVGHGLRCRADHHVLPVYIYVYTFGYVSRFTFYVTFVGYVCCLHYTFPTLVGCTLVVGRWWLIVDLRFVVDLLRSRYTILPRFTFSLRSTDPIVTVTVDFTTLVVTFIGYTVPTHGRSVTRFYRYTFTGCYTHVCHTPLHLDLFRFCYVTYIWFCSLRTTRLRLHWTILLVLHVVYVYTRFGLPFYITRPVGFTGILRTHTPAVGLHCTFCDRFTPHHVYRVPHSLRYTRLRLRYVLTFTTVTIYGYVWFWFGLRLIVGSLLLISHRSPIYVTALRYVYDLDYRLPHVPYRLLFHHLLFHVVPRCWWICYVTFDLIVRFPLFAVTTFPADFLLFYTLHCSCVTFCSRYVYRWFWTLRFGDTPLVFYYVTHVLDLRCTPRTFWLVTVDDFAVTGSRLRCFGSHTRLIVGFVLYVGLLLVRCSVITLFPTRLHPLPHTVAFDCYRFIYTFYLLRSRLPFALLDLPHFTLPVCLWFALPIPPHCLRWISPPGYTHFTRVTRLHYTPHGCLHFVCLRLVGYRLRYHRSFLPHLLRLPFTVTVYALILLRLILPVTIWFTRSVVVRFVHVPDLHITFPLRLRCSLIRYVRLRCQLRLPLIYYVLRCLITFDLHTFTLPVDVGFTITTFCLIYGPIYVTFRFTIAFVFLISLLLPLPHSTVPVDSGCSRLLHLTRCRFYVAFYVTICYHVAFTFVTAFTLRLRFVVVVDFDWFCCAFLRFCLRWLIYHIYVAICLIYLFAVDLLIRLRWGVVVYRWLRFTFRLRCCSIYHVCSFRWFGWFHSPFTRCGGCWLQLLLHSLRSRWLPTFDLIVLYSTFVVPTFDLPVLHRDRTFYPHHCRATFVYVVGLFYVYTHCYVHVTGSTVAVTFTGSRFTRYGCVCYTFTLLHTHTVCGSPHVFHVTLDYVTHVYLHFILLVTTVATVCGFRLQLVTFTFPHFAIWSRLHIYVPVAIWLRGSARFHGLVGWITVALRSRAGSRLQLLPQTLRSLLRFPRYSSFPRKRWLRFTLLLRVVPGCWLVGCLSYVVVVSLLLLLLLLLLRLLLWLIWWLVDFVTLLICYGSRFWFTFGCSDSVVLPLRWFVAGDSRWFVGCYDLRWRWLITRSCPFVTLIAILPLLTTICSLIYVLRFTFAILRPHVVACTARFTRFVTLPRCCGLLLYVRLLRLLIWFTIGYVCLITVTHALVAVYLRLLVVRWFTVGCLRLFVLRFDVCYGWLLILRSCTFTLIYVTLRLLRFVYVYYRLVVLLIRLRLFHGYVVWFHVDSHLRCWLFVAVYVTHLRWFGYFATICSVVDVGFCVVTFDCYRCWFTRYVAYGLPLILFIRLIALRLLVCCDLLLLVTLLRCCCYVVTFALLLIVTLLHWICCCCWLLLLLLLFTLRWFGYRRLLHTPHFVHVFTLVTFDCRFTLPTRLFRLRLRVVTDLVSTTPLFYVTHLRLLHTLFTLRLWLLRSPVWFYVDCGWFTFVDLLRWFTCDLRWLRLRLRLRFGYVCCVWFVVVTFCYVVVCSFVVDLRFVVWTFVDWFTVTLCSIYVVVDLLDYPTLLLFHRLYRYLIYVVVRWFTLFDLFPFCYIWLRFTVTFTFTVVRLRCCYCLPHRLHGSDLHAHVTVGCYVRWLGATVCLRVVGSPGYSLVLHGCYVPGLTFGCWFLHTLRYLHPFDLICYIPVGLVPVTFCRLLRFAFAFTAFVYVTFTRCYGFIRWFDLFDLLLLFVDSQTPRLIPRFTLRWLLCRWFWFPRRLRFYVTLRCCRFVTLRSLHLRFVVRYCCCCSLFVDLRLIACRCSPHLRVIWFLYPVTFTIASLFYSWIDTTFDCLVVVTRCKLHCCWFDLPHCWFTKFGSRCLLLRLRLIWLLQLLIPHVCLVGWIWFTLLRFWFLDWLTLPHCVALFDRYACTLHFALRCGTVVGCCRLRFVVRCCWCLLVIDLLRFVVGFPFRLRLLLRLRHVYIALIYVDVCLRFCWFIYVTHVGFGPHGLFTVPLLFILPFTFVWFGCCWGAFVVVIWCWFTLLLFDLLFPLLFVVLVIVPLIWLLFVGVVDVVVVVVPFVGGGIVEYVYFVI